MIIIIFYNTTEQDGTLMSLGYLTPQMSIITIKLPLFNADVDAISHALSFFALILFQLFVNVPMHLYFFVSFQNII